MPFCSQCGGDVIQGAAYCRHCGASVGNTPESPVSNALPTQRRGGGFRRFLKWGGMGCGVLVLALVTAMVCSAIIFVDEETGTTQQSTLRSSPEAASSSTSNVTIKPTQTPAPRLLQPSAPVFPSNPGATAIPTATPTPIPTLTPTPTPFPTPTPVPIDIDLVEMLREYEENKVRANARLRYQANGKTPISTSGYVNEVEELYVSITPDQSSYAGLDCYYSDVRAAFHLSRGQLISVTGRVNGEGRYSGSVAMFGCEIQGIHLEQYPTVSLDALRKNTVQVFCMSESFLFSTGYRGTGIILDAKEGTILTVHHVFSHDNNCESIEVQLPGAEGTLPASVIKHCASIDRAQLQVSPHLLSGQTFEQVYWASAPAQTDQGIYFWGFGTGELRMESGLVENTWGDETVTDAYAVPGDSGSPVFNEFGHLLGTMSRSNVSDRAVFTGDRCLRESAIDSAN